MSPHVRYVIGDATAIAGPHAAGLFCCPPDDARVHPIAIAVTSGAAVSELTDALFAVGGELPAFALVIHESVGERVLVRGTSEVVVGEASGGERRFDGRHAVTWHEALIEDAARIVLRADGGSSEEISPSTAGLALVAGIAPASMVLVELREVLSAVQAYPHSAREAAVSLESIESTGHELSESPAHPRLSPSSPPVTGESSAPSPEGSGATAPAGAESSAGGVLDFGHLLGETVYRDVEESAVRHDTGSDESTGSPAPTAPITGSSAVPSGEAPGSPLGDPPLGAPTMTFATTTSTPAVSTPTDEGDSSGQAGAEPGSSGIITSVPGSVSTPEPPPSGESAIHAPHAVASVEDDEAGMGEATIGAVALRGTGAVAGSPSSTGVAVQAVHCPRGHPNPPYATSCRNCRRAITDRTVAVVPRPVIGRLRFEGGPLVPLDRPLLIGRKPPESSTILGEPAGAVRLPDPERRLSRIHAEVRLVDWQVQVVDRDSMNHTFVEVPGQSPVQLRPAEAFPIPIGTVVSLGQLVSFVYEVEQDD